MTTEIVPTRAELELYRMTIDLGGDTYQLDLRYAYRDRHWYLDFSDVDGNPVRSGLKCVVNTPLLLAWVQQGRPEGEVLVVDPATDDIPDRDRFGALAPLVYGE